ncbi:MAG: VWA domain-containing protein [Bacteroidota bacterium]
MMKALHYYWIFALLLFCFACQEDTDDTPSPSTDGSAFLNAADGSSDRASSSGETSSGGNTGGVPSENPPPAAGQITAGEWSDLVNWDFWLGVEQNEDWKRSQDSWELFTKHRYQVQVQDRNGLPVVDATATLHDTQGAILWQGHTDASGVAELWSIEPAASAQVTYRGQSAEVSELVHFGQGVTTFSLPTVRSCPDQIDVLFAVDATGSMGDELEYLKSELSDVISRIEPTARVRLSTVFYRDEGDEYVTRSFRFTDNVSQMIENIRQQSADGGGDYPEAVHSALEESIQQMNWSSQATARLLFLLLDAPPHENPEVKEQLQTLIPAAAKKGIRIIPISASGIDKPTEFLLRTMAILTQGTYVFITDHSGIGNDHLEPTIGEYEVELLNDLLVRLINEYGAKCGQQL